MHLNILRFNLNILMSVLLADFEVPVGVAGSRNGEEVGSRILAASTGHLQFSLFSPFIIIIPNTEVEPQYINISSIAHIEVQPQYITSIYIIPQNKIRKFNFLIFTGIEKTNKKENPAGRRDFCFQSTYSQPNQSNRCGFSMGLS